MDLSISDILEEESEDVSLEMGASLQQVPYPQANSLDVVLRIVKELRECGMSVYDLVTKGIVNSSRQARYYFNAAAFLGFCYRRGDYFYPTELVARLKGCEEKACKTQFAAIVLGNEEISRLFSKVFMMPDKESRLNWISNQIAIKIVAEATLRRRATCLLAWISWVQKHLPQIKG